MLLKELEEEATYLYHPDHLGSVSVVSNQRGLPYERVEYLPFGEVWIEETDPATGYIPFRFTSKELDEETGLYYYGARYYEPTISRWMSADPAGFALVNPMERDNEGGWKPKASYSIIEASNWYAYVSNNPVIYVDPTGMELLVTDLSFHQEDAEDDSMLGNSTETSIDNYGCVLTAYTKIANAIRSEIGLDPVDLEYANERAKKLNLFLGEKENLLSKEGGVALINDLVGPNAKVGYGYSVSGENGLADIQDTVESLDESYAIYAITGRLDGHHVNVTEHSADKGSIAIQDTSNTGRTEASKVVRIDVFNVAIRRQPGDLRPRRQ